jgi:hypothetical protein
MAGRVDRCDAGAGIAVALGPYELVSLIIPAFLTGFFALAVFRYPLRDGSADADIANPS